MIGRMPQPASLSKPGSLAGECALIPRIARVQDPIDPFNHRQTPGVVKAARAGELAARAEREAAEMAARSAAEQAERAAVVLAEQM